jgi:hypothetical protein
MTIHVINRTFDSEYEYVITINGPESQDAFKELVRRALNCWPDAHPSLKEMGDMLDHGKILQDYYAQRTDLKRSVE